MSYVIYPPVEAMRVALEADLERLSIEEEVERGAFIEDWLDLATTDEEILYGHFTIAPDQDCEMLAAWLRAGSETSLMVAVWSFRRDVGRIELELLGIPSIGGRGAARQAAAKRAVERLFDQRRTALAGASDLVRNAAWMG